MNERTFLQEAAGNRATRDRLETEVEAILLDYVVETGITEDELATEDLAQLAEGFVERGFGVDG